AAALEQVEDHYVASGWECRSWTMNSSAPAGGTQPIIEKLLELGFRPATADIMLLQRESNVIPASADAGIKIIPARASFRHTRQLFEEELLRMRQPAALAAAAMLH